MLARPVILATVLAAVLGASPAHGATLTTDLHGRSCTLLAFDRTTGASTRQCRGVAGFDLLVHDEAGRTSVDIAPRGRKPMPLNFWDVVSAGYSTVGRKAEWHMARRNGKLVPVALVVMVNEMQPAGGGYTRTTLAAVTRIGADDACVVYRMDAALRQAGRMIRAAAANPRAPCLGAVDL